MHALTITPSGFHSMAGTIETAGCRNLRYVIIPPLPCYRVGGGNSLIGPLFGANTHVPPGHVPALTCSRAACFRRLLDPTAPSSARMLTDTTPAGASRRPITAAAPSPCYSLAARQAESPVPSRSRSQPKQPATPSRAHPQLAAPVLP
ncbi:hypothetical protein BD779DRAFT_919119 [Infundibulicybe gibba]|nr:hypothetical protein BD779DRAFT_919119 [Infundibulicybe gibba]